ncbi:hypothetical protein FIBSPDRAFT_877196 [Athelia psychrophila]|uniref:Uncharacterized protein n=1 Tax=Athelia psychrophila TaxID=1759441 RepID=A0A167W5N6_9AGAM|nr:hypothetical protein FIBSPDRAFT_877196 [Fibularhizoctonia sp. CBS 109695]
MSIRPYTIWFREVPGLSDSGKVQLVLVNSRCAPLPVHATHYARPGSTIDSPSPPFIVVIVRHCRKVMAMGGRVGDEERRLSPSVAH